MGDYLSSPFEFQAEGIRVFNAFLASTGANVGTEAVEAAIKESIQASIKRGLVGSLKQVKKLLQSGDGVQLVMKQLGKLGWKQGDEITGEMMEQAIRNIDNVLTQGIKGVDNTIQKELADSFTQKTISGSLTRNKILKGIPNQSLRAADNIATDLGLDAAQTAGLRKLFQKSAYGTFNSTLRSVNRKAFLKLGGQAVVIGGAGYVIWWGVTGTLAAIADLGSDLKLWGEDAASTIINFATDYKWLFVAIGLGGIGLFTYKFTSALMPEEKSDDAVSA